MRRMFIIVFLLLIQHNRSAVGMEEEKNAYSTKLSAFEERKEDYTTKLLAERFDMLCEWKKTGCQSPEKERLLSQNKIALIYNAKEDVLNCIFDETNEQDIRKYKHTLQDFINHIQPLSDAEKGEPRD